MDKGKTSSTPTVSITGTAKSGPTYSSSSTSIATVNRSTGVVTGVSAGSATITISYTNYDGSTSNKTCTVTIKAIGATVTSNTLAFTPRLTGYIEFSENISSCVYSQNGGTNKTESRWSGNRLSFIGDWWDVGGNTFVWTFVFSSGQTGTLTIVKPSSSGTDSCAAQMSYGGCLAK